MPATILVIDDEELLIKTMSRLLEKHGYQVYIAKNASDAEVMAEEEVFDLIISDIRMPGKNGVEVIKSIQAFMAKNKKGSIPVIFVTGFTDPAIEEEVKKLKPLAYLMKPFDLKELIGLVEKQLPR